SPRPCTFSLLDASLTAGAFPPPSSPEGPPSTGAVLLHFTDADPAGVAGDYTATVVWGDGSTENSVSNPTTVQIVANAGGGFDVIGSHTYAEEATGLTFSVSVAAHGSTISPTTTASPLAPPHPTP